jgi:nitrate/nitrite transport system substrate-binding protein
VARQVNRIDLYREAAEQVGVPVPSAETRASTLMDGRVWDAADPVAYAEGFEVWGGGLREAA